jgi:two-component system chemotaxis response regulator CheY
MAQIRPAIICIDDQREILAALERDMDRFSPCFSMVYCEDTAEARDEIEVLYSKQEPIALIICDHIMPGQNGIDFLIELNRDARFKKIFKIMLTGLATHSDTIQAINSAKIDYYIEKPWDPDTLIDVVKKMLTLFIIREGLDYHLYARFIDPPTLYQALRERED